jgi:sarcosine oxidase gamma subunit
MVAPSLGAGALVLDVGDSWEGWRITGPGVPGLLARICTLDVAMLRPGVATRTAIAGLPVILRLLDGGCELRVERSYADWFETWLRHSRTG